MENRRRSSRKTNRVDYRGTLTPSYPESAPQNRFEERIAQLNNESFDMSSFSIVDDVLVYSIFSSKRHTHGYRTMIAERAFREEASLINKEQALTIRHIYKDCVGEQGKGTEESIKAACDYMAEALPNVFSRDREPILHQ
jgi:hypothetical protein